MPSRDRHIATSLRPTPAALLTVGGAMLRISPSMVRVLVRALVNEREHVGARVDEAMHDGQLEHADMRARRQRMIDDLLAFLADAGVSLPQDYQPTREALPSERQRSA